MLSLTNEEDRLGDSSGFASFWLLVLYKSLLESLRVGLGVRGEAERWDDDKPFLFSGLGESDSVEERRLRLLEERCRRCEEGSSVDDCRFSRLVGGLLSDLSFCRSVALSLDFLALLCSLRDNRGD